MARKMLVSTPVSHSKMAAKMNRMRTHCAARISSDIGLRKKQHREDYYRGREPFHLFIIQ